jgi:parallel beta-helix repeat protein
MDRNEQRRIAQAGKEVDPGWYRVHRRVSIHLTRGALALGLTANQASLSMIALGVAGAGLLVPSAPALNAAGLLVLYLAFLLDKVDGEIARLTGTANARGIFLDRLHHRLVEPLLFVAVAAHEGLRGGGALPLVAGFATVVLANAIDENQHLAAYILYKRAREGAGLPTGAAPPRSPAWARAAALLRPLKGFRMFIVALPLYALAYAAQAVTGAPYPTFALVASAGALAAYLVFQCLYYLREQLDAEAHAIARVLSTGTSAPAPHFPPPPRPLPGEARDSIDDADGDSLMEQPRLRFGSTRVLLVLLLAVPALLAPAPAGAAGTYYVDSSNPACSNSGPGTAGTPYCSISAAVAAQNGAGTTIRVAPGVYPEQVTVPASGTSGNPFVIEGTGTPANPALLEGADNFSNPGLWSPAANTTWLASSATWSVLQVLADGDRLVPFAGAADSVPVGGFLSVPGTGLYVNLGGDNPGEHNLLVGRRMHGLLLSNRSWVTIRNLRVHGFNSRGIFVDGGGNQVIENNVIDRVGRYGINLEGSTGTQVRNNRVSHGGDHGIALTSGTTGSTVEGNESHGNARPAVRAANGIYLFGAPGNRLRRNRLHHNQDSGMHIQSGSNLTVSVRNLAWANGDHGFDHLGVANNTHAGDVAYGNHTDGFSFEGNTQNQQMFNCISAFNGLATGRYQMYADSSSVAGFSSNDNLFWDPTDHEPVKFNKIAYPTVAAYSAATGLDTRTLEADPRFVDGEGGDLRLLAGSPAIDRANSGAPLWESADFQGMAPIDDGATANAGIGPVTYADRGAYEYGATGIVGVPGDPPTAVLAWGVTPNPLAGEGVLAFTTSRPGPLSVDLYDVRGRRVRGLLDEEVAAAGPRTARLDGRGDDGAPLEAGIYFYRVRSVDGVRGGKFVVVR